MYLYVKKVLDRLTAIVLLVITFLPLLIIGVIGSIIDRGPIIFSQSRGGRNGRVFTIYKMRTMQNGEITSFGRMMRRWSLDELPQLWNIVIGDMSFIGPRPLLTEYEGFYSKEQKRRQLVTPGITGLAQVNGRNELGWERRFELDVEYVEKQSLLLDLKILIKTARQVFNRKSADFHLNKHPKFSEQATN
ncbi:MAG: sugar transferase [Bacteroidota bacterium]